jgi:hypothetical protein
MLSPSFGWYRYFGTCNKLARVEVPLPKYLGGGSPRKTLQGLRVCMMMPLPVKLCPTSYALLENSKHAIYLR